MTVAVEAKHHTIRPIYSGVGLFVRSYSHGVMRTFYPELLSL